MSGMETSCEQVSDAQREESEGKEIAEARRSRKN